MPTETEAGDKPEQMKISVRGLVEFLLREGDIDNRRGRMMDNAMQEGGRIHRMIQKRMGAEYQAEVSLRYEFPTENYCLVVEGRADGVVDGDEEEGPLIDEIKGTYRELSRMNGPVPVHLAQAKCYACIYGVRQEARRVRVRMTYCNMDTEDIRYFQQEYAMEELKEWFLGLLKEYKRWSDCEWEWRRLRGASIEKLEFPFQYREGQKELASYVYQTIYHRRRLFLEAPTGVGKTISTVFPSVKAAGKGMGDKIFYLTAKTITRTVAEETFELLRRGGLRFKTVILTAKEKICFMDQAECNPEACPFAKGHYDRINEAVFDLLTHAESFTRERIEEYAGKHSVCPFEMCLDMSLFADGIICDYNYLFDPRVYLKRFFSEGLAGNYIFLIDEAHNLLERGREMYSASLVKEEFTELKREVHRVCLEEGGGRSKRRSEKQGGEKQENVIQLAMDFVQPELEAARQPDQEDREGRGQARAGHSILVREGYAERMEYHLERCNKQLGALKKECDGYSLVDSIDDVVNTVDRLYAVINEYLEEQEETPLPVREDLLNFYFKLCDFLDICERLDENYVKYTQLCEDGSFLLKLFCVNPSLNLRECMARGRSSILFSATFLPIQYYKGLLGGEAQDYEIYAKPVFNPDKRALLIASDVTSKYTRRSDEEFERIARYLYEIVKNRHGNYMVFFPSYSFMQRIYELFADRYESEELECILQQQSMNEREREAFLDRFSGNETCDLQAAIGMEIEVEEHTLIGFCVMGGIFSEGIDLKNDSLIGVIIVGTGLPQVCYEREILKNYFNERGENGFDYAYRFPGMNKVLQAAGRVIRTAEDIGVVALLDERFLQFAYQRFFPREWENYEAVDQFSVARRVERFWDEWL